MLFYPYINVFLRREDSGHLKKMQQKHEQIDSVDSLCADLGRFHFNASFCKILIAENAEIVHASTHQCKNTKQQNNQYSLCVMFLMTKHG